MTAGGSFRALAFLLAGGAAAHAEAVITGTVFRDPGFALPNAEVTIEAADGGKFKKMRVVSGGRGEFTFRLPEGRRRYVLQVKARGFAPASLQVEVEGAATETVTFTLSPESKDPGRSKP
jgi:hypothetical protein